MPGPGRRRPRPFNVCSPGCCRLGPWTTWNAREHDGIWGSGCRCRRHRGARPTLRRLSDRHGHARGRCRTGTQEHASGGDRRAVGGPGDPEVGEHHPVSRADQDVRRLHVPVDDACRVRGAQRGEDLQADLGRLGRGERSLVLDGRLPAVPGRSAAGGQIISFTATSRLRSSSRACRTTPIPPRPMTVLSLSRRRPPALAPLFPCPRTTRWPPVLTITLCRG